MSNMIRLANITANSSVDGPGLRTVVWFQGCPHHCIACHNPQTQSVDLGSCISVDDLVERIERLNNKKITLSGGDPFLQSLQLLDLVERLDSLGFDIWCYTGYIFEHILHNPILVSCMRHMSYLVDGPFIKDKIDHNLMFRGSSNQRVIDLKQFFERNIVNDQSQWYFIN